MEPANELSRRERQIMDVIYAKGEASATEVVQQMASPPSRTSVRTILTILEEKGHLSHTKRGREFVYKPTRARRQAGRSAFRRVVKTFFDGSVPSAVAAHLTDPRSRPSDEELKQLAELIEKARKNQS